MSALAVDDALAESLRAALRGAGRVAIVGVGDELHADDRVGLLAANAAEALALRDALVVHAGTMPESHTGVLRRYAPTHVLLLDAAELGHAPGDAALLEPGRTRGQRYSTHAMPLHVVASYIESELGARVLIVGIQPGGDEALAARRVAEAIRRALER